MSEGRFTADVLGYADSLGLLTHHCPDSRRCRGQRGFPDVVALGPRGILLAELKAPYGTTSPAQDSWLWTLHVAGIPYTVWEPRDWKDERVQARLRTLIQ